MLTADQAEEWLRALSAAATADEARLYLENFQAAADILAVYRAAFPREYRASLASFSLRGEHLTEMEIEFLHLVQARAFPLMESLVDFEERSSYIPFGLASFELEAIEALSWAEQFLAGLVYGPDELLLDESDVLDWLCGDDLWDVDFRRFTALCRRRGGIVALVPDAVRVVALATDTEFLDVDYESYGYVMLEWSVESFRHLKRQWQLARRFLNRYARVVAWLDKDCEAHAPIVLELWRRSCGKEN